MLEEAISSVCGAAGAVGGQVGREMEERGETLVPAAEKEEGVIYLTLEETDDGKEEAGMGE
jgi:hypothetical protein